MIVNSCFIVSVAKNVVEVLPGHRLKINELKKDGYQIIDYCRKSVGETANRVSCLQRMVDILYKKSLVDKVFVSPLVQPSNNFSSVI